MSSPVMFPNPCEKGHRYEVREPLREVYCRVCGLKEPSPTHFETEFRNAVEKKTDDSLFKITPKMLVGAFKKWRSLQSVSPHKFLAETASIQRSAEENAKADADFLLQLLAHGEAFEL